MKMHYCTCRINLAGQNCHIVEVYPSDPMSWPEVQVMMQIHTEENVFDIKPIAVGDTTVVAEKRRLAAKYRANAKIVESVFPGRSPRMEMTMPGEPENQPTVDEYGIVLKQQALTDVDDDEPVPPGGHEPPIGPAVFQPVKQPRSFGAQ
jgi:hypothetical protein